MTLQRFVDRRIGPQRSTECALTHSKTADLLHELEKKYLEASHQCDLIVKDEEKRREAVRAMIQRHDAESLKQQVSQKDTRINELVEQAQNLISQLTLAQDKSQRQDKLLQAHTREIRDLKVAYLTQASYY